jgi:hypothetical protein
MFQLSFKLNNSTLIHKFQSPKFNVIMPKLKLLLNLNYKYPIYKKQTNVGYLPYEDHLHSQK